MCGQFHQISDYFWELEQIAKDRPTAWVTNQKKQDETWSWMVVESKGSTKRTNIRNKLERDSNSNHSNYWTPLTSQAEELANITRQLTRFDKEKVKRVSWKSSLLGNDRNNSKMWRN